MSDETRVREIYKYNLHMVVSTADKNGNPWVTPLAYTFDSNYSLYWMSSKDSRHSINVRARKEVALVIYNMEPPRDAVYIDADVNELNKVDEILQAIDIIRSRPQPDKFKIKSLSDVSGEAAWRIYKATPKSIYIRELSMVRGQAVTIRRKITL